MQLFKNFNSFTNNTAFVLPNDRNVSFSELDNKADALANKLRQGSLVLIISKICYESILGYIAALRKGAVVMFADFKTDKLEIATIIHAYNPDFIFAPRDWFDLSTDSDQKKVTFVEDYKLLEQTTTNNIEIYQDLAVLLPTSGSLGNVKYVRLSHKNLASNAKSIINYLGITEKDRAITTMPIGYSYMLSILNSHLEVGASIVICNHSIVTKEFWQKSRLHQITSLSGVPIFFQMLIRIGIEKISIPTLRQMTQAGGNLSNSITKKLIDFCEKNEIAFFTMYGQTEASPRISYLDWVIAKNKIGSIGKPIPGVEMWLETKDGNKIDNPYIDGEIVVSGPNICLGYASSKHDLKRGDDNKGVIRTGDLAQQDPNGFFFITGRLKRIAKINGFRINLDDIEEKMKTINIPIACIEGQNKINVFFDNSFHPDEVLEMLHTKTNQNKASFLCIQVDALPLTSNGKINYKKLHEISNA